MKTQKNRKRVRKKEKTFEINLTIVEMCFQKNNRYMGGLISGVYNMKCLSVYLQSLFELLFIQLFELKQCVLSKYKKYNCVL